MTDKEEKRKVWNIKRVHVRKLERIKTLMNSCFSYFLIQAFLQVSTILFVKALTHKEHSTNTMSPGLCVCCKAHMPSLSASDMISPVFLFIQSIRHIREGASWLPDFSSQFVFIKGSLSSGHFTTADGTLKLKYWRKNGFRLPRYRFFEFGFKNRCFKHTPDPYTQSLIAHVSLRFPFVIARQGADWRKTGNWRGGGGGMKDFRWTHCFWQDKECHRQIISDIQFDLAHSNVPHTELERRADVGWYEAFF